MDSLKLSDKTVINIYFVKKEGSVQKKQVQVLRLPTTSKPRRRWLTFTAPEWLAILEVAVEVVDDLVQVCTVKDREYEATETIRLKTTLFKGCLYIGFQQRNGQYTNIVNLTLAEWREFEKHIPYMCKRFKVSEQIVDRVNKRLLERAEQETLDKAAEEADTNQNPGMAISTTDQSCMPVVLQYRWTLCSLKDGSFCAEDSSRFFLVESCRLAGEQALAAYRQDDSLKEPDIFVLVTPENKIMPDPEALVRIAYVWLLRVEMGKILSKYCQGCLTDRPGQNSHMDLGGCLDDFEPIRVYDPRYDESRRNIQNEAVSLLLLKTCEVLGIAPSVLFTEIEAWPKFSDDDIYTYSLLDNGDFGVLFNNIACCLN